MAVQGQINYWADPRIFSGQSVSELHYSIRSKRAAWEMQGLMPELKNLLETDSPRQPNFWSLFLSVPPEIRELIYAALFESLPSSIVLRTTLSRDDIPRFVDLPQYNFPALLPPFCYVTRQIFHESVPIFLRTRSITIGNWSCMKLLSHFCNRVPDQRAWKNIQDLTLESEVVWMNKHWRDNMPTDDQYTGTPPYGCRLLADNFLLRCPGLKCISIELQSSWFCRLDMERRGGHLYRLKDEPEVSDTFAPSTLFSCSTLHRIELRCITEGYYTLVEGLRPREIFQIIARWFEDEIEKRKLSQKIELTVVYIIANVPQPKRECVGWESE